MEALPKAFIAPYKEGSCNFDLSRKIRYQFYVTKVNYESKEKIVVTGLTGDGRECTVEGSRILLTVSLTILKNIVFTPPLSTRKSDAITDIYYCPSTKILLLFKERFWEKGPNPIKGGFSKSTDTLGQLHYPTRTGEVNPNERGVLVSYTWERNALVFGTENSFHSLAIRHALDQVKNVHPKHKEEIENLFEGGQIQSWVLEPSTCGAFVYYNAYCRSFLRKLATPEPVEDTEHRLFFSGEGISVAHGWIQGAIESGLLAALLAYASFYEKAI